MKKKSTTPIHSGPRRPYRSLAAASAILLCGTVVCGEVGIVDCVVAIVNDRSILFTDVSRSAVMEYRRLAQKYSGPEFLEKADEVYRKTLTALIERQIVLATVENPNSEAIDLMVQEQLDEVVRISFKGDRSAFLDALAAEHLPLQEWKNEVRDNILISIFTRNEVDSKVLLSPSAIRREYDAGGDKYKTPEAFQLRIIALRKGESDADMALIRRQADAIWRRAADGEDFVALQKSSQEDAGPSAGAGEPDWIAPGDLRPEVARVVSGMKAGEISPVVEAGDSLLILKVEARRAEKRIPFEEVRGEIERRLKQAEQGRLYDLWIGKLRKNAYVRVIQAGMPRK